MIRQLGLPAVLVLALALTGCATVEAPEPGFSDADWVEFVHAQGTLSWEYSGLAPELQPPFPPMEFVSEEEYADRIAGCMNEAGFGDDPAENIELGDDTIPSDAELIASFDCSMRIVVQGDEGGLLNRAQREYAYDYYEHVLVPCLMVHGIALNVVQTRAEFHEDYGVWNPYSSVREEDRERVSTDDQLREDCLPVAPGMTNFLYYGFFG